MESLWAVTCIQTTHTWAEVAGDQVSRSSWRWKPTNWARTSHAPYRALGAAPSRKKARNKVLYYHYGITLNHWLYIHSQCPDSHTWRLSDTITLFRTRYICHPIPRISTETKPLFLIFYPHLYFYYLFSVLYIYLLILNTILNWLFFFIK